jgi:capsular exopolysaccharide synthesis family protein
LSTQVAGHQDLIAYARIFWRWRLLFLAIVVAIPAAVYLYERSQPPVYQSSTLLELQSSNAGNAPVPLGSILSVARLVTTTPVAKRAAEFLNVSPAEGESLVGEVSTSADTNTGFLTITVVDRRPDRAAAIADAFAKAIGGFQTAQQIQSLKLQIAPLVKQLALIPRSDGPSRASVTQQIAMLRSEEGSSSADATILQPATANRTPVGPKTRRSVELALIVALLLGIGAVVLAENSDRRLRTPDDLEHLTNWPLLGVIPASAFAPDGMLAPREEEAFHTLRGDLEHFNVERSVASVSIISPLVGDGKTTVAVGLAVAAAKAGQRAVIVDADLRRPQVAARLGLDVPNGGLSDVLAGAQKLSDVLLEHSLHGTVDGSLRVVPAGSPPANPTALINSPRMREVLRELEAESDLVVIDTAALLAVSDALPLLRSTSGVVMVVRMNRSSRTAVRRLQRVVMSTRGAVLGVVATGTSLTAAGYGDYYAAYGDRRRNGERRLVRFPARHRRSRNVGNEKVATNGSAGGLTLKPPRHAEEVHDEPRV